MKNMIFDTHAHYDDAAFDEDRDELLSSFVENNIGCVIDVASDAASIEKVTKIAHEYPFVYEAVGIHPDEIYGITEDLLKRITVLCKDEKTVAVGEIGLDYYRIKENRKEQIYWFERFADLARTEKLPIIIHSREAAEDTLDTIKRIKPGDTGAVMHCYSYSKEMAKQLLDMGLYFGIGGVATFKNARKLIETIEYIPMSSILLETDCPYLAPVPFRGKRNCSLYIPYVVKKIAQIKNISEEEVMNITFDNALRLFKKIAFNPCD